MGLRDRLKRRVRRLTGGSAPVDLPRPARREGLAAPPSPAADPGDVRAAAQQAAAERAAAERAAAERAAARSIPLAAVLQDTAAADAPVRNAHHRPTFETTDAAIPVAVYDTEMDRWLEFPCEPGETVLDAAERAGLALPYSCRSGGCLSCAARIIEGSAEMDEQYVLEEEHITRGFTLLCCTTVTSPARFLGHQEHEIDA